MASGLAGFGQTLKSAEGSSESHDDFIFIYLYFHFISSILALGLSQDKDCTNVSICIWQQI